MIAVQEASGFLESILTSVATLVAAFLGAWFAFGLENKRQSNRTRDADVTNVNLAIFSFIRAHNTFLNIKSQVLGEFENDPARHHFIKPVLWDSLRKIEIDYPSLAFLLRVDPNLLGEIAVIEQDINGTIDLIRDRSKLHYEQLQPAVERLHRGPREEITIEEVEAELGPRSTRQLLLATNYMVDGVNRAIQTTQQTTDSIRKAAVKAYPGQKFIRIAE